MNSKTFFQQTCYLIIVVQEQKGSINSRQNLNENLETLHLAPTLFYHLPGFYLKTGFINPLSFVKSI